MTEEEDAELLSELEADEGIRRAAYQDSLGFWTIGIGRLIDGRRGGGLSDAEIRYLAMNDLARVDSDLDRHIPWWRALAPVRRRALRNLCFNMGFGDGKRGLSSFKNTLAALQAGDFDRAADGLAGSRWARQVQASRSGRIIRQIRTGSETA
jgi:lysozyme